MSIIIIISLNCFHAREEQEFAGWSMVDDHHFDEDWWVEKNTSTLLNCTIFI